VRSNRQLELALFAAEDSYCDGETFARRSAERAGAKAAVSEKRGSLVDVPAAKTRSPHSWRTQIK
jgi:hypothetical protein